MYYLGDGVYGSFNCILFDHYTPETPIAIGHDVQEKCKKSRVFGPTCDGLDMIYESVDLPILEIGDLLVFNSMGAYTKAAASNFNGICSSKVVYIRIEM